MFHIGPAEARDQKRTTQAPPSQGPGGRESHYYSFYSRAAFHASRALGTL
jgi:hypothetical protein